MSSIRSYRELLVWQKAMDLAASIYKSTYTFPKEEKFGLVSQMRRAVASVPANIAEGNARRTRGEYLNALSVSYGSLAELETFLILSEQLEYLASPTSESLLDDCSEIGKILNGLMNSLKD